MPERGPYSALIAAKTSGKLVVLATIVHDQGSVPRHAGSKMLVDAKGTILAGTIGGGELESRVIGTARRMLAEKGRPELFHYELSDPSSGDPGLCGGEVDIFLEPIMPDPTVLVIGCGHVGQAVAELAHWLGYRVIVSDDREDMCNPDTIPLADEYIVAPSAEISSRAVIHEQTYIAAVTRGVPFDVAMLPDLLATPAPYIGVLGSRRRWATAVKELREKGVDEASLQRVHAPVGLELQAETPREIALSILAEIVATQRGGSARPMKWHPTRTAEGSSSEAG